MKKLTFLIFVAVAMMIAVPVLADGAFTDVPSDHWAYDSVNTLQQAGLVQGYPNGTFQGKRTISRYEFAMVIARLLPIIEKNAVAQGSPASGISRADLDSALSGYAKKSDVPGAITGYVTKDELNAVRRLVDEFRDELAALSVDVDSIKKELAGLTTRVDALEKEDKRFRLTGEMNVIGKSYNDQTAQGNFGGFADLDSRSGRDSALIPSSPIRDISVYRDFNMNIDGVVNDKTTAHATINYGNYLSYLNGGAGDTVTPYYMYMNTDIGFGDLTVGRFPLQLTPYTFKMVDADSYTTLDMTDSGNRSVDGAKIAAKVLGLDWTFFAAENDAVPALDQVAFTQSAGVRTTIAVPYNGKLGLTYYQGWNRNNYKTNFADIMNVYGADYATPLPFVKGLSLAAEYAKSQLKADGTKVTGDDQILDAKLQGGIGSVKVDAGYKWIGADYVAPGYWDTVGQMKNPTNVKGVTADAMFKTKSLSFNAGAELLKPKNAGVWNAANTATDDKIDKYTAGVKWGYCKTASLGLDAEYVSFDLAATPDGADKPVETYVTLNWNKQLGENTNLKVGYQLINYNSGQAGTPVAGSSPYGSDYRGGLGVVQMGVSF